MSGDRDPERDDPRHGGNVAVLVIAAVIIGVFLLLLHLVSNNLKAERCVEERRQGCGDSADQ
jgi:hypothetical protein